MNSVALIIALACQPITDDPSRPLSERIEALAKQYESRDKAFYEELKAANGLEGEAREKKILDENVAFQADWDKLAGEMNALINAHPDNPAALDGMIALVGTMRWFLSDAQIEMIRRNFMKDPRMGRLCLHLANRNEVGVKELLIDVARSHPDRAVRGQATYTLGMYWRRAAEANAPQRASGEAGYTLDEARRYFARAVSEFDDVISADGSYRIGTYARAELDRIANMPNLKVGKPAPEINGEDLDGKAMKLSDYHGKVVVVCFWATWCGPCMAMVPHERELATRMEGKPFALLGVNCDMPGDRDKAKKATVDQQMTWRSWWDGNVRGPIQTAYNVQLWPTVYVVDSSGVIRYIDVRGDALDRAVDELTRELETAAPGSMSP